jgi:rod shape-determining protein MreC
VVSIATYRDERGLFAVIGVVIIAALLALLQIDFARQGRPSPITATVTTISTYAQLLVATVTNGLRDSFAAVINTPQLARENTRLRAADQRLRSENRILTEALARVPAERNVALAQLQHPAGIPATVIGYDPEATQRIITIDRGAHDRIARDDGVVTADGAVGRVIEVAPISSKVLLIVDAASKLPAVVQHGRWWSIAVGTQTHLKLQYVSQDAKLRLGDIVVTGEGRSFHAGTPIGRISAIAPANAGALDQSAIVEPAVAFGSLSRVLVLAK